MPVVPPRPAATIMLVRDGDSGMEVFMTVRHHAIEFASGALVFPGGRVEDSDHAIAADAGLHRRSDPAPGFFVAGIRETFEECGILLARPCGADRLLDAGPRARHRRRVQRARRQRPRRVRRPARGRGSCARHRPAGALRPLDHPGDAAQALRHGVLPRRRPAGPGRTPRRGGSGGFRSGSRRPRRSARRRPGATRCCSRHR